jgi:sec-independent protein translocase protein TatC
MKQKSALQDDTEQPLVYHLIELRDRLLRVVLVVGVIFVVLVPFSNTLFSKLSGPLLAHLPDDSSMIAIEVASPFLIPFKLTLFLALFLAIPYVLYQLWSFVAPGLYQHERRLAMPLLVSSTALFYAGAAFAYFVVFPLVFAFFTSTAPEGVSVMTDISRYLDFVLTLFFAFGLAFEVPIFTILLVWTGMATPEGLREKRPYIIVAAFVIGMLLTPPDIISQTLLAVPIWVLFELGVYFSGWFLKQKENFSDEKPGTPVSHYRPMSDEEMDAELDRMENEDKD